ncbi:phosphate ABC transporter permease [Oculatella sp. LEGE 06141]|uniref:phosphate ABC transporter permease n=1 Tax=Oculatella sp. LEGE 06141 TaxID=1828648 RepID=UPI001880C52F|nr:phosphate ABC transporter permease [Oculatella sp. LEGE 06141]MBE9177513.1 phosphate ABC transporter permease [Oculatella sp. LEGE 06141]
MLIPLTRKKFEELVPLVATVDQYRYAWGKLSDFLRRLLISVMSIVVVFIVRSLLGEGFGLLTFILGVTAGLYWFWSPIYLASLRNLECRKYQYSGFFRGEVLDMFITEELIGKEETVNKLGELVIVENRERRLNLEVGDESGFTTQLQVPLQRAHKVIRPGDIAEMIVMSNRPDLSRISKVSDIYLSDYSLWVYDYPYLRRDSFIEVSRQLQRRHRIRD